MNANTHQVPVATDPTPVATASQPTGIPAGQPATSAWRIVAAREIMVKLTNRNFVITTIFTLLLMVGSFALFSVLGNSGSNRTVAVVDDAARSAVEATHARVHAADDKITVNARSVSNVAEGERAVRDRSADALLTRGDTGWRLVTLKEPNETLTRELSQTVRELTLAENASAAGTSVPALTRGSTLTTASLTGVDTEGAGVRRAVTFAFALLFYMAALMFGLQIASSVVEEKQSRIVEILTTAIPVRALLTGKVLGNTALAFAQMALYAGVGLLGMALTKQSIAIPVLAGAVGWFLAFFLAGFLALACVWAVAGSLASRQEDLQSTTTPVTIVLVVAYAIGFSAEGTLKVITSYVPILSAITMPSRVVAGEAAWWEPVASILITLGLAAVTVLLGERLYRRSLLQLRGRVSLRTAWSITD